ncbi:MAG: thioredoxin family protein [Burkholderiaceae bacterium]
MGIPLHAARFAGLAALIALVPAGPARAAAVVGQPAPEFTAPDLAGRPVRLADYRGKFVVLEWTNPGCPFVRKHYQQSGNLPALQKEFTARGVAWIALNSTETGHPDYLAPAQLGKWFAERGAAPSVALMDVSGTVGRAYGAKTTPHMYVIDPAGRLVYAGAIDSVPSASADDIRGATNYVRQALAQAMAGQPVSTPTSVAYGCSIKYSR